MPRLGPRMLFFSGGTALRETAAEIARYTSNTLHLVTPFDSGGSSAALRRAFAMPAVGDARSRVMALADKDRRGNDEVYTLFAYRLPDNESRQFLEREMVRLLRGSHPLLKQIPEPMNGIIREHLIRFSLNMPPDFPLAGANIGNLVLTAGYLGQKRRLGPVLALFSRMVRARGMVRPIVENTAHLAVRLETGQILVGQHLFTGKGGAAVNAPIADIWLTAAEDTADPVQVALRPRIASLIRDGGCIFYPVGSFYSSVVANLLPQGVGRAVAANPNPKVFVPNLGNDPELKGHTLEMQIRALLRPLQADAPDAHPRDLLSAVLLDQNPSRYPGGVPERLLAELGIQTIIQPLVAEGKGPLADPRLLAQAVLQLAWSR